MVGLTRVLVSGSRLLIGISFVQPIPQYKVGVLNITTGREGVLDQASHTYTGYTINAGEHFSLPAHGSVLVVPRILSGSWSRKFACPSKELIFVFSRRSFWTDYIRNEARGSVRVVLFYVFGRFDRSCHF